MAENTPNLDLYKKDPVVDRNDSFNITTMLNDNWDKLDAEVAKKVDVVEGKDLSANDFTNLLKTKLEGIEKEANNYSHPVSHAANMIVENASKRFVSDAEKSVWGNKETPSGAQTKATKALADSKEYTDGEIAKIPDTDISGKVDKVPGKTLSTNDYDNPAKAEVAKVKDKVDKVPGKDLSKNDYTDIEKQQVEDVVGNLANHLGDIASEEGRHGVRYWQGKLEIKVDEEWTEFKSGEGFKVGNVETMKVEQQPALKINVSFGSPKDSIVIDENEDEIVLAEWAGTMLRGKLNSYPVDENDGELLEDIKVRDKYKSTPFVHEELTDGDEWYYMAFPYTKNNVFTVDSSNRGQATATKKLSQDAPSAPTVSGLKFDKATVKGASGTEVRIDSGTWYDSPHEFTGLTEETGYTAYARMKETSTKLPSESSVGKSFTTPSDMPGPSELVGGDMEAGYFGIVPAAELYTGDELAVELGITQGTSQFSDAGWLKFAIDGTIIYKSKKPFRHTISWDHIDSKGCVDGTKTVTKDGTTYKVRLMKGALTDPGNFTASDRGAKGSEWNRLMLPIHVEAKSKNWAYPAYVESDIPYWGIDFTDADLQTHDSHGNGSYHWCQEVRSDDASSRFIRGYLGVSSSVSITSSYAIALNGWSPVLEVVS